MSKQELRKVETQTGDKQEKLTGLGGKRNFPSTAQPDEPGENARYLRYAIVSLDLPPIDISDINQCEERAHQYFNYCIENNRKPNIVGLCNWLGVSRDTFHSWRAGQTRASTHTDFMKKCVSIMEEINVDYLMDGKVYPGSGIFILKNHFGYKDVTDITVEPRASMTVEDAATVAARYQEALPDE